MDATFVDTDINCPGCGQRITVVSHGADAYSECGGEGEGGCEVWIKGDASCEETHESAIAWAQAAEAAANMAVVDRIRELNR